MMLLDQIKRAISVLNHNEFQELIKWIKTDESNKSDELTFSTPGKAFLDDSTSRRDQIIKEISQSEDFMIITVQKRNASGQQPIAMHTSRQNKIGPALLTLICQDSDFCEALGEMVDEARRRRLGFSPTELFP